VLSGTEISESRSQGVSFLRAEREVRKQALIHVCASNAPSWKPVLAKTGLPLAALGPMAAQRTIVTQPNGEDLVADVSCQSSCVGVGRLRI
jgi:hypothetical protein